MLSIFLLLVSIQTLNGLICYSNDSLYFSLNDFNWNNVSTNINTQQTSTTSPCHVRITVNYTNDKPNNVIIKFGSPIDYNHTHIEFGSRLVFFNNEIQSIISYLDYTCLSENLCDKIFLEKWAKQLLNASDNSLHNSFIPLWNNSNICHSGKVTNVCESYLCFMIYDELKHLSYGKSQCDDKLSTNPVYIHIKTYSENQLNDYKCMKNLCTNQVIYNLTLDKDYTNDLRNYQNEDKTNELILFRAVTIVGILLIIGCIAYCIQYRNYRQGYRLTRNV